MTPTMLLERTDHATTLDEILDEISRREFIVGAAALGSLLVGCSSDDGPGSASPTSSGPWAFTDDRGVDISIEATPERFAAFSTAAAALGEFGLVPAGMWAWSAFDKDPQLRFVDTSGVESLGEVYGEINLEKLAAIQPELVVDIFNGPDPALYSFKSQAQEDKVGVIAPTLGIDAMAPLLEQFDRWRVLAKALGADVEGATVKENRGMFEAAADALSTAAVANAAPKVLAVSANEDAFYAREVEATIDLAYYESLGVSFVHPEGPDGEPGFFWEELSWERVDTYPADVILLDIRGAWGGGSVEAAAGKLASIPTWNTLPAVLAGQVVAWHAFDPAGYRFYTEAMDQLTTAIESAQVVT